MVDDVRQPPAPHETSRLTSQIDSFADWRDALLARLRQPSTSMKAHRERIQPERGNKMMVEKQGSGRALWTGRIMSGLVALFLLVDGGARLAGFAP